MRRFRWYVAQIRAKESHISDSTVFHHFHNHWQFLGQIFCSSIVNTHRPTHSPQCLFHVTWICRKCSLFVVRAGNFTRKIFSIKTSSEIRPAIKQRFECWITIIEVACNVSHMKCSESLSALSTYTQWLKWQCTCCRRGLTGSGRGAKGTEKASRGWECGLGSVVSSPSGPQPKMNLAHFIYHRTLLVEWKTICLSTTILAQINK